MKRIMFLSAMVLLIVASGCAAPEVPSEVDDYMFYDELLRQNRWEYNSEQNVELRTFVIAELSSTKGMDYESEMPGQISRWIRKQLPSLQVSTRKAFEYHNQNPVALEAHKFTAHAVSLLSEEEKAKIFTRGSGGDGWWPDFYERYPNAQGILTLSRVGVNSEGTQALLYYGSSRAGLSGMGEMIILEKHNDRWIITERVMVWQS